MYCERWDWKNLVYVFIQQTLIFTHHNFPINGILSRLFALTQGRETIIVIPMEIADKVRESGYIYKGHPNSITVYPGKTEERLGIPHFPLHKLRHYFASKMSALNVPEADIMKMGGRETNHVMKSVYRHYKNSRKPLILLKNLGFAAITVTAEDGT